MRYSYIVILVMFMMSCVNSKKDNLAEYLTGTWEATYVKITVPTIYGLDSLFVHEELLNSPKKGGSQDQYKKNGIFSSWYQFKNGQKLGGEDGIWKIKQDSLYVEYKTIGSDSKFIKRMFAITKTVEGFHERAILDWDNDGKFDDTLFIKKRRITQNNI